MNWSEWKTMVRRFLTDRQPTDANFAAAVAEYVRARIARDLQGDAATYGLVERRYTSLRRSLIGYTYSGNDAALLAATVALLRPAGSADSIFVEAAAEFVRSKLAGGEVNQRYMQLRLALAGAVPTINDTDLKTAVKARLSDGARTDEQFAQACAWYAKAYIAREVDARGDNIERALALAERATKDYTALKQRLVGFESDLEEEDLLAEVVKYLPVDANRANVSALIPVLIKVASQDIKAFGPWVDEQVLAAKADLVSFAPWISAQIAAAKDDLQALGQRVDGEMRAAAIDLQTYVTAFTAGHTGTFEEADMEQDGSASAAWLPDNLRLRAARLIDETRDGLETPCVATAWEERIEKLVRSLDRAARVAVDPKGRRFMVSPALVADSLSLVLEFEGVKLDFEDEDCVPFDEDSAQAAAAYVNAALAQEWGEAIAQAAVWRQTYIEKRTNLYLKHRARAQVR